MKYATHKNIMLGDLVYWKNSSPLDKGIVVCLIDEGVFLDGYDFSYLKDSGGGIMILFDFTGLVQIMRDDKNIDIEVDGGINAETGKKVKEAGANILVAGSYIFNGDYKERIDLLKLKAK